ncbi:MAG: glycine/betaine ABC transporter ATP-binding protein [Bacteroidetes bacterium]|nr:MAG: glycine/betaine ABC transporter ATP-binding protein [Bacteroidota bacterium]PTM12445.1 MAG: glycine/betaine ABC transporter ATP-binding protein [Bacteroidota bacterium]
MITVHKLSKSFGSTVAVEQLSFTVETGQTLALVGTSGSGKTTTLKMLNRLVTPSSGAIYLNGIAIHQQPLAQMRRQMGYVIQQVGLFPHYTVAGNIAVVPRLLGWSAERIAQQSRDLLTRLKLPPDEYLYRYPAELSGGQQQRVGIARALAADPPVVLMDEPFSALDPITRQELRRDFLELDQLRHKTVILVTHDVQEAFELADQICLLDGGRLQQLGTPADLLFRPANAFVRRFLAPQRLNLAYLILRLSDLPRRLPTTLPAGMTALPMSPTLTFQAAQSQLLDHAGGAAGGLLPDGSYFSAADLTQATFQLLQQDPTTHGPAH